MARARNIKPSTFKNELLGVADPLLTLLFISLWTLADKEGRLEDRPLRIKAETFPYREGIDVNGYLTELQRLEFIDRYVVDDVAIIQIINFSKHQSPHSTEKKSELPCKPIDTPLTVNPPLNNESTNVDSNINVLIPDSLNIDSLNTDCGSGVVGDKKTNKVIELKIAEPPQQPSDVYTNQKFSMFPTWEPSQSFETLAVIAGVRIGKDYPIEEFYEFRSYWVVHPDTQRTQGEWEHAFIKNWKVQKLRNQK